MPTSKHKYCYIQCVNLTYSLTGLAAFNNLKWNHHEYSVLSLSKLRCAFAQ